jgi:TatD DNase family protein
MRIFDSHAHYDDPAFDPDREELLAKLPEHGVALVLNAGTTVATSLTSLALAEKYHYIYAAVGLHPEEVENILPGDLDRIERLARSKKCVAIGEIGLDYHYEGFDRQKQLEVFEAQLKLACKLDMPVVIHDRDAHGDTMHLVTAYRPRGVLHCFSGSAETAAQAVALGLYIGFTGSVTFKNNRKAPAVLGAIPRDRILLETDCPYMAPVPDRGRRCDSTMISYTAARIGEIIGLSADDVCELGYLNASRLYGIG